jgi:hypothetical protein
MCGGVGVAVGVNVAREMEFYTEGGGRGRGGSVHGPRRNQLQRVSRMAAVLSCIRAYSIRRRKIRQFSDD